ncbi:MAG: hypothetical protein ABI887_01360 [Burkholderiales bacterium]
MTLMMMGMGHYVVVAEGAESAFVMLQASAPDVLFADPSHLTESRIELLEARARRPGLRIALARTRHVDDPASGIGYERRDVEVALREAV